MNILKNLLNLLISPRFISFYWKTGITAIVGFIALTIKALPDLGAPEMVVALVVLVLQEVTKALNNLRQGKEMGFAAKK